MDAPIAGVAAAPCDSIDTGRMVLTLPGTVCCVCCVTVVCVCACASTSQLQAIMSVNTVEDALRDDGSFGRSYIVQGEQLRVWLVLDSPLTRERAAFLAALDILCSFAAPGVTVAADGAHTTPTKADSLQAVPAESAVVETVKVKQ